MPAVLGGGREGMGPGTQGRLTQQGAQRMKLAALCGGCGREADWALEGALGAEGHGLCPWHTAQGNVQTPCSVVHPWRTYLVCVCPVRGVRGSLGWWRWGLPGPVVDLMATAQRRALPRRRQGCSPENKFPHMRTPHELAAGSQGAQGLRKRLLLFQIRGGRGSAGRRPQPQK